MNTFRKAIIVGALSTLLAGDIEGQDGTRRDRGGTPSSGPSRIQSTESAPAPAPAIVPRGEAYQPSVRPPSHPPSPPTARPPSRSEPPVVRPRESAPPKHRRPDYDGPGLDRPRPPYDPPRRHPARPRLPDQPPRRHPATWDWHHHCPPSYQRFFAFSWWGPWCWDAPYAYRGYANPGTVVRSFDTVPPPGYDEATITYFKNGFDRTIRVELSRPVMTRGGIDIELTVLRDDRADGDLEQAVRLIAPSREEAVRDYFGGIHENAQRNRLETLYQHFLYRDTVERLRIERLW